MPQKGQQSLVASSDEEQGDVIIAPRQRSFPWRTGTALLAAAALGSAAVLYSQGGSSSAAALSQRLTRLVSKVAVVEVNTTETTVAPPCKTAHADDSPSLFCWAVMFPDDQALITSTFTGRAGIFACNDYAVISTEKTDIGEDDCGITVSTWQTEFPKVEKGTYGVNAMTSSWLNVPIFLICWEMLIKSGNVWEQDFTVKVDPDTVFFPQRLGAFLQEHAGNPVYTTDCRYWGGDPVGKVFGSIEVVSKQGMGSFKENMDTCKNLPWQGWGEDYWLGHCMQAIGVESVIMADVVTDGTCPLGGYADCGDPKFVALHPYKDAGAWWECWKASNPGA